MEARQSDSDRWAGVEGDKEIDREEKGEIISKQMAGTNVWFVAMNHPGRTRKGTLTHNHTNN